jgi:hypothetical protein
MDNEYKIIHVHIFDPGKSLFKSLRRERAQCNIVKCCNSENCDLYKRKQCCRLGGLFGSDPCPYGKYYEETGFTKNARKYSDWIWEKKKLHADNLDKLEISKRIMAVVGDYIWLPYSFMDMNKDIKLVSKCFLHKDDFNIETIASIVSFIPRTLFDNREIGDYQKESVPMFIKHWYESKICEDLYEEFSKIDSRASAIVNTSNVGRSAILQTLTPNVGSFKRREENWYWDGEYLYCTQATLDAFAICKADEIRIKPKKDSVVVVTDDNQVNENTKFVS